MARKAIFSEHYRLVGTYQRLRKNLLDLPDDGRLDKQLNYWVEPTDRRLPIAFLDRTLRELLDQPFDALLATRGVGQKKVLGFFDLLTRAAKADALDQPFGLSDPLTSQHCKSAIQMGFDPSVVSEALWSSWCDTVKRHSFASHKLGRLAPSLQSLPTVIWHTPLAEYAGRTLSQIRALRTHGEKRVNVILEIFCTVHEAVATSTRDENLELDLLPRFVPRLTRWLTAALQQEQPPTLEELRRHVVNPLLRQTEIDLGEQVASIAGERLPNKGKTPTVKELSNRVGVTRARIYQLLEDCAKAMEVRWPEGRWLLAPLAAKSAHGTAASVAVVNAAIELFYPDFEVVPTVEHPQANP